MRFFCVASLDSKKYLSHAFESVFDDEDDDDNDEDDVGEGSEIDSKKAVEMLDSLIHPRIWAIEIEIEIETEECY